jgi:hypothetical protein
MDQFSTNNKKDVKIGSDEIMDAICNDFALMIRRNKA